MWLILLLMTLLGSLLPLPARAAVVASNIHNAAGWLPSHSYTQSSKSPFTRVVNGPGWSPGNSSYNSGATLNAYELVSPGTCTSAAGSGPDGSGSSISDGTCVWKYLSKVDYVSLTGWAFDAPAWVAKTYTNRAYVTTGIPLRSYALFQDGGCASTIAPTGNAKSPVTLADGCTWQYRADILFSSRASFIPALVITGAVPNYTYVSGMTADHQANLWNDREYIAGRNGELYPFTTGNHHYGTDDLPGEGPQSSDFTCSNKPCHRLILTTAPGEGFRDNASADTPLTGYDITRGVGLHGDPTQPHYGAAFAISDAFVDVVGLQFKSTIDSGIDGIHACFPTVQDSIIEGTSGPQNNKAALQLNCFSIVANSLVISHGPFGAWFKYDTRVIHSIIVNPHGDGVAGLLSYWNTYGPKKSTVFDTGVFGFSHAEAWENEGFGPQPFWSGARNVTDAPAADSGTFAGWNGFKYTAIPMAGATAYGVSRGAVFVAGEGKDYRLTGAAPLGRGEAAYGTFDSVPRDNCDRCSSIQNIRYNFDNRSIFRTPAQR